MFVKQIRIESLGNSAYLVGSEESDECAVVDPTRDVDLYLKATESMASASGTPWRRTSTMTSYLGAESLRPALGPRSAPAAPAVWSSAIIGPSDPAT